MRYAGIFFLASYEIILKDDLSMLDKLKSLVPNWVKAWRSQRIIQRSLRKKGVPKLTKKFVQEYGYTVRRGPFEGMKLPEEASERHLVPYLIGSAECELHETFQVLKSDANYTEIVNIGSAMGYYAVGLGVAFPETPVYAFDISSWAQNMTRKTAAINNAENVQVLSECTPDWMSRYISPGALIVCDCEGCEFDLLSPEAVPAIEEATLVIEMHGSQDQNSELVDRFSDSHDCSLIESIPPGKGSGRDPSSYPELQEYPESEKRLAVSDLRGCSQTWLYATP